MGLKKRGEVEIDGETYPIYLPVGAMGLFAEADNAQRNNEVLTLLRIILETVRMCVPDLPDTVYREKDAEEFMVVFRKVVDAMSTIARESHVNPTK